MTHFHSKLYNWYGQTLFWGRLPNIQEHSHHALQIEIGLERAFKVSYGKQNLTSRFTIIPPDVPHRIDDCGSPQAIIYLEPESRTGKLLKERFFVNGRIEALDVELVDPFLEMLRRIGKEDRSCGYAGRLVDDILQSLMGDCSTREIMDQRIKSVIEICKQTPEKKIPLKVLANSIHLSEGRLRHLFKQQVGIPIRRYLLWLRLSDALMELSKGGTFTDAAHHAGFSDSAHLSRTYRRMYGNSLYDLARNSQFIQAIPCFE